MPTQLHIVDPPSESPTYYTYMDDPGAMFRWPPFDKDGRECWCISLPNRAGLWWTTYEASDNGAMWDVEGVAPLITVHPSIDAGQAWHGWIKDGVMNP